MNLDNRISTEEGQQGRDHRARSQAAADHGAHGSPGTPTERTVAGGPTHVSRPEARVTRDATADDGRPDGGRGRRADRAAEQRRAAERQLGQVLRLPDDTRLDIAVDVERDEVRFLIRERASGRLLREVPPDESKPLLDKLREFSGALVDRSF